MTLQEICKKEFSGEIYPEQCIEFAYAGKEDDVSEDYLDEILETHGDQEVDWYTVSNSFLIKVLFKKED